MNQAALLTGRLLLALLFLAGAIQKAVSPQDTELLLEGVGLPSILVWPALVTNAIGAFCLITGIWLAPATLVLASYCLVTSVFHFIPAEPWQMSIFVKNWAIAGGLLVLFSHTQTREGGVG